VKRLEIKLFEVSVIVRRSSFYIKTYYDFPLKRVYIVIDWHIGPKHKGFDFWFPPSPKKVESKRIFIVCQNYHVGERFAIDSGWDPRECIFLNTSLDTRCLRGLRIDPKDIHYTTGWYLGKHSHDFQKELKLVVRSMV